MLFEAREDSFDKKKKEAQELANLLRNLVKEAKSETQKKAPIDANKFLKNLDSKTLKRIAGIVWKGIKDPKPVRIKREIEGLIVDIVKLKSKDPELQKKIDTLLTKWLKSEEKVKRLKANVELLTKNGFVKEAEKILKLQKSYYKWQNRFDKFVKIVMIIGSVLFAIAVITKLLVSKGIVKNRTLPKYLFVASFICIVIVVVSHIIIRRIVLYNIRRNQIIAGEKLANKISKREEVNQLSQATKELAETIAEIAKHLINKDSILEVYRIFVEK